MKILASMLALLAAPSAFAQQKADPQVNAAAI